jgi:hypothetical protein
LECGIIKDPTVKKEVMSFLRREKQYRVHYTIGCPADTNSLEGFFGWLDTQRRKQDLAEHRRL